MLFSAAQRFLKNQQLRRQRTFGTAVASAEQSAESVSFQRYDVSFPPCKNVNSADTAELAAVQFSGSIAFCEAFAAINAIFGN